MNHPTHSSEDHAHVHGPNCGHVGVLHNDHIDYLHEGHLHHPHQDHVDEHELEATDKNPTHCSPLACTSDHKEAQRVPHAGHFDLLVDGRLHHAHDGHCDDHGSVSLAN